MRTSEDAHQRSHDIFDVINSAFTTLSKQLDEIAEPGQQMEVSIHVVEVEEKDGSGSAFYVTSVEDKDWELLGDSILPLLSHAQEVNNWTDEDLLAWVEELIEYRNESDKDTGTEFECQTSTGTRHIGDRFRGKN